MRRITQSCQERRHTVGVKPVALLFSAAALAAAAATFASARVATRPTLRLVDASPVAFRGANFKAHERVRVSVYARERATKRLTAGARGGFVVRFGDLRADRCGAFFAVAVGNLSSRATFKRPLPECPPP
jgi:hypothetical protein